jgi:hypothetical protein
MITEEELSIMYTSVIEQQEALKGAAAEFAKERANLAAAIDSIKNASSGLQTAIGSAASKAVIETLAKAPETAVAALSTATEALDAASGKVRAAGAWISLKFVLVFVFAGAAAVATNYTIGRFTLPNRAEIDALRSEKAELEAGIADLAKRGGRIKLSTCGPDNRLCVRITPKQGSAAIQRNFQGSWVNDSQQNFVIPFNY